MIKENVKNILVELPGHVTLQAAAKSRTPDEIEDAIDAGIRIIGENYVNEAEIAFKEIGKRVRWHYIGHLQKNKVKKAIKIFDLIETVDSIELAEEIDKHSSKENKIQEVLIEVNSAKESQKFGVSPEEVGALIKKISQLKNIKIMGLMTLGPLSSDPEDVRPYFKKTRVVFYYIRSLNIPNVDMKYLSMGMSDSYKVAIQEGANIVRIGTKIFGNRE
ncbi:MAG: YggS family pyridoxal phosphate-dependent enzyme [Candidatus Omnitrophota bacterium]